MIAADQHRKGRHAYASTDRWGRIHSALAGNRGPIERDWVYQWDRGLGAPLLAHPRSKMIRCWDTGSDRHTHGQHNARDCRGEQSWSVAPSPDKTAMIMLMFGRSARCWR